MNKIFKFFTERSELHEMNKPEQVLRIEDILNDLLLDWVIYDNDDYIILTVDGKIESYARNFIYEYADKIKETGNRTKIFIGKG